MGREKLVRPLVVAFTVFSGIPAWAGEVALDLSSTTQSVQVTSEMLGGQSSVPISNGGESMQVSPGSVLTPAQYVALLQAVSGVQDGINLSTSGAAVGGQFHLDIVGTNPLSTLVIPQNVTAIHQSTGQTLNILGSLSTSGTLFGYTGGAGSVNIQAGSVLVGQTGAITTNVPTSLAAIYSAIPTNLSLASFTNIVNYGAITSSGALNLHAAGEIVNHSGAVMSAVNNLNLFSGAGLVNNAGSIASSLGNINLNTIAGRDLVLNNIGGQLLASNAINMRTASYGGKELTEILGGTLNSSVVDIFGGEGLALVRVDDISGLLNVRAGELHVATTGDGALNIGSLHITGDPTIVSTGLAPINITNNIFTNGADLAIISKTDIFAAPGVNISTTSITGEGGTLTIAAGYDFVPGANPGEYLILGPSFEGGSVVLGQSGQPGVNLKASSGGTQGQDGALIQVFAHGGDDLGSGQIRIFGVLESKSNTGNGGTVAMVAHVNPPIFGSIENGALNGGAQGEQIIMISEPLVAPNTMIAGGTIVSGGFFIGGPESGPGSGSGPLPPPPGGFVLPEFGDPEFNPEFRPPTSGPITPLDQVNIGIGLPQAPTGQHGGTKGPGSGPIHVIAGGTAGDGPDGPLSGPTGGTGDGPDGPLSGAIIGSGGDGDGQSNQNGPGPGSNNPYGTTGGDPFSQGQGKGQGNQPQGKPAPLPFDDGPDAQQSGRGGQNNNTNQATGTSRVTAERSGGAPRFGAPVTSGTNGVDGGFVNVTPQQVRMTLVTRANQILSGNLGGRGTTLMASEGTQLTNRHGVVVLHAGRLHADTGRAGTTIAAGSAQVHVGPDSGALIETVDPSRGQILVKAVAGEGSNAVEVEIRGKRLALAAGEEMTVATDDMANEDMIDVNGQMVPVSAGITRYNKTTVTKRSFPVEKYLEDELLPAARSMNLLTTSRGNRMLSHVGLAARRQNPNYAQSSSESNVLSGNVSGAGQLDLFAEPGSRFKHSGASRLELVQGMVIFRAPSDFTCTTENGTVFAKEGGLVAVESRSGVTRVRSLSGPGDVKVVSGSWHAAVSPGEELLLSDHRVPGRELNPSDGIGRRNSRTFNAGNVHGALNDFSIASMINNSQTMREFIGGDDNLFQGLLKTAVAVDMVTAGRGRYNMTPKETASAAEETIDHKLAQHK